MNEMKTDHNYRDTIGFIFVTILAVFVVGAGFVGYQGLNSGGSGVEAKEANILKSGQASIDMLFKYLGAIQQPVWFNIGQLSSTVVGQGLVCLVAIVTLLLTNLLPDDEIAVGRGSGKHTKSTELAYGSLAYIEPNARPTVKQ